jgi:hypothetical protein
VFFNNGNNRLVDANDDVCGTPGQIRCYRCGGALFLSNGDLEYDVALAIPNLSYIQEVTPQPTSQLVWQMNIAGQLAYRGFRIPGMYPGVEWTPAAIAAANVNATPQPAAARKAAAVPPSQWRVVP